MEILKLALPTHDRILLRAAARMLTDLAEAIDEISASGAVVLNRLGEIVDPPAGKLAPPDADTGVPAPPDTATAEAPPLTGELDGFGRPWDARIHTAARTKLKNGGWKYTRGVDKALVAQIEAGTQAPEPAAVDTGGLVYADIQARVDDGTDAGMLRPQAVLMFLADIGVKSMPELAGRPDLWPAFAERLDMVLGPA